MTERFPFGPASTARSNPTTRTIHPLSLINSYPFGSARSSPGREAAQRTLDGEDRLIFLCTPVITTNCRCYGMMEFGWNLNGTRPRT